MKRNKHSLSYYKLATCDMGKLIPIGLTEVLPGDTIQGSTSILLRMTPLQTPPMHPISVRVHHWYVPNRLVFPDWGKFITGGADGLGEGSVYPVNAAPVVNAQGDLLDYFGVPPATYAAGKLTTMPQAMYNLIYNENYRDEDLITAVAPTNNTVQNVAWEKDYFTTARPWTQKGPNVTLPLGSTANVRTQGTEHTTSPQSRLTMRTTAGNLLGTNSILNVATTGGVFVSGAASAQTADMYPTNLIADLSGATAVNINQVRLAFALQRLQEARAQYGSRYVEYLRYLGITPSDARLDRPEYLGGSKQTISFSEVLRTGNVTADASSLPIGEMAGHGIAAMRSNRFRYFVEEHGYIMTLLSIRPRSMYVDGLDRIWSRRTKEDYFQRELERIGQQQVFNKELRWVNGAADDNVFGYQDRYAEYRHQYSGIAGNFRTILNDWHLARIFGATPTLNPAFINCDPGKRIMVDQTTNHSCLVMASHSLQARRLVGMRGVGRIL